MENRLSITEKMLRDILLNPDEKPIRCNWENNLWNSAHIIKQHGTQSLSIRTGTKVKT
jgi:hypothetical protein